MNENIYNELNPQSELYGFCRPDSREQDFNEYENLTYGETDILDEGHLYLSINH